MEAVFDFVVIAVLVFCVFRMRDMGYEINRLRLEHVYVVQELRNNPRPPGLQSPPKNEDKTPHSMEEWGSGTGKPAS